MTLDDLADFVRSLTNKELEIIYEMYIKNILPVQVNVEDLSIDDELIRQKYILSKIEEELHIRHLRETGLQAWNAGQLLKGTQTKMFIDGVEVGNIKGDIEFQEYGAESVYKDVDITKELPEFPKLKRFKKDLL